MYGLFVIGCFLIMVGLCCVRLMVVMYLLSVFDVVGVDLGVKKGVVFFCNCGKVGVFCM